MQGPETRESLINQLRDTRKQEVWTEFVRVYQPLIYNFAIARGVQHSDALDVVQEVLSAVTNAVGRFQKQPGGSFRGRYGPKIGQLILRFHRGGFQIILCQFRTSHS